LQGVETGKHETQTRDPNVAPNAGSRDRHQRFAPTRSPNRHYLLADAVFDVASDTEHGHTVAAINMPMCCRARQQIG